MANLRLSYVNLMRLLTTKLPPDSLIEILQSLQGTDFYIPAIRIASNYQAYTAAFLRLVFATNDLIAISNVLSKKGFTEEYFPQIQDFSVSDWIWILSCGILLPDGTIKKYPNLRKAWDLLSEVNQGDKDGI